MYYFLEQNKSLSYIYSEVFLFNFEYYLCTQHIKMTHWYMKAPNLEHWEGHEVFSVHP